MRITKLSLVNFYGIYLGMGLSEIEFDFSKQENPIILLKGDNGVGKSVFLSVNQPFMSGFDENRKDLIIPGKDGVKRLTMVNKNDIYEIELFFHRKTNNKAYIKKNGIELNENGNITSYEEMLDLELGLKPEFFKIGKIGDNVSTFVDFKATERKKYISKFLPQIDDYLIAFSIVSKKHLAVSKILNVTSEKIKSLPEFSEIQDVKNNLQIMLKSNSELLDDIKVKLGVLYEKSDKLTEELGDFDVVTEQTLVENVEVAIKKDNATLDELLDSTEYDINTPITDFEGELSMVEIENANIKKDIDRLTKSKGDKQIESSEVFKNKVIAETELKELEEEAINSLKEIVDEIENEVKELKNDLKANKTYYSFIKDNYTRDEINQFLENSSSFISNLDNLVDSFKALHSSYAEEEDIDIFYSALDDELRECNNQISSLTLEKQESEKKLSELQKYIPLAENLKKRPNACKIDSCAFIVNSLKYKNLNGDISVQEEKLKSIKENLKELNEELLVLMQYDRDRTIVVNNINLLNKSKDKKRFFKIFDGELVDFDKLISLSINTIEGVFNTSFKRTTARNYTVLADKEASLKSNKEYLKNSTAKSEKLLEKLQKEVSSNTKKYETLTNEIKEITIEIKENNENFEENSNYIDSLEKIILFKENLVFKINALNIKKDILEEKNDIILKLDPIEFESAELETSLRKIEGTIEEINTKLDKYKIMEANYLQYQEEKNILTRDYEDMMNLKKALDIKTGIPLIFTGVFLEKIKHIANRLLDIAYDGKFQIGFNLTDTEFSIPVTIDGADTSTKDDIKAKSQGEVAMTKLIISMAMIENSMSEYNILSLDEVDGTLSKKNRRVFASILDEQIDLLELEQVFVISHNEEFSGAKCDYMLFPGADQELKVGNNVLFNASEL